MSCNFIEKQTNREPIAVVDTVVDFNSVDAYPLFPECKDIPSRDKQKICFQMEMSQHIYASLKEFSFNAENEVSDTVLVKLKVDNTGKTSLSDVQKSNETQNLLPEFDSILMVSISKVPILQPAIKRSIPVTTEFTLPIILKN